ncbi:hypothetical protein [Croceicoccus gelatinilyticus]|uniref:hypothetical protein n=1 Tax=Croceicoccus gelatinilyticus TaxID=2835536 RepID=UPI001BD1577D|nr:hypothetical protein [Croceicoccus gelatinilyticus]MBS7671603.1 hypothetical protein [Croceicoccus gelatinilyticus]
MTDKRFSFPFPTLKQMLVTIGIAFIVIVTLLALPSLAPANEVTSAGGQKYAYTFNEEAAANGPSNADLKMVDSDKIRYAADFCGITKALNGEPRSCSLYVQDDPDGTMIGYAILREDADGVSVVTQVDPNKNLPDAAKSCWVHDQIKTYDDVQNEWIAVPSIDQPFEGRIYYQAKERSPGDWLYSGGDVDWPEAAGGVWYIKSTGDNLRITQERWNYCYTDTNVDEVFKRIVTLKLVDED